MAKKFVVAANAVTYYNVLADPGTDRITAENVETLADAALGKHKELIRQAFHWLADEGIIKSRREIRKLDMIDMTEALALPQDKSAMPSIHLSDEELAFAENNWCHSIPPLSQGCVRINRERYVQFRVETISEEEQAFSLTMMDYSFFESIWVLESAFSGIVFRNKDKMDYTVVDAIGMEQALRKVDPYKTGWDANNRHIWKKITLPKIHSDHNELEQKKVAHDALGHFVMAIIKTNYQLSRIKPKAVRAGGRKVKGIAAENMEMPKKQIVRTIGTGGIKVISEKIPRCPTEESVRKYKVAAWNTRGHLRHYKNGKTVYVKPSVHHRKCLKQTGETAQTVICLR